MRKARQIMALSAAAALTCLALLPSFAAASQTLTESQAELERILAEQQQVEERLAGTRSQEAAIGEEIRLAQERLAEARAQERAAAQSLEDAQQREAEASAIARAAEAEFARKKDAVARRLQRIHRRGPTSQWGWFLEWIKGEPAPHDGLRRLGEVDSEAIAAMRESRARADDALNRAGKARAEAQQRTAQWQERVRERQAEEARLRQIAEQLMAQRIADQALLDSLAHDEEKIREQIARLSRSGRPAPTGQMIWPVSGPLTSLFGWREHPLWGGQSFHHGIDIAANTGVPIVAVLDGVVILAEWDDVYGNNVMIDHGGGYVTRYAHASRILVSVGQSVSQGETIALIGSTGWSTGPHLHFEVRINGEAHNPLDYLD